ncbi:ribokinase [Geobacillus sp. G4]|uniref:Ribokinase n=2 Tax=Geobacillus thermoleovorans group TaxID=1505648 RepID=A0A0D8BRP4_GEOKU|nr:MULTISPECIES: ribokinase [Geobacillus]AEV20936.1 Ribokinase [Geobacillus thermoleovorans CCB_US3_UF5]AOL35863.1 ribokinase [Geobacillus thermoleovorans]EQB94296.1 ribokinase [Geobacillus sp. A8]KJE26811.1 ribokinase [Geobacillus kaustophilus]MED3666591.1 ribokinase [Geobacillus kaustophilus]
MNKPTITVIGSINMDLVTVAARFPNQGETILGERFLTTPGGKGANQAVAAARLGANIRMIGAVGDDAFGQELIRSLQNEGISVDYVKPVTHGSTGIASITISERDNRIIVVPGANHALTPEDLDSCESVIAESDVCLLQLEIPLPVVERAVSIAHRHGVRVIVNPAPAQPLPPSVLEQASFLTPNEHERTILFDKMDEEAFADKLIVTEGAKGVRIWQDGQERLIPSFQVPVVDTTGAGDTFNGALAVALAEGKPLDEACRFANAAAALSVTKLGAQAGMPRRQEVESFLSRQKESH